MTGFFLLHLAESLLIIVDVKSDPEIILPFTCFGREAPDFSPGEERPL
jgi:hypothetical protein